MASRINRAIELLQQDQAIYYTGHHTGHLLTYEEGRKDAQTWADYINVGMEHGAFDLAGLEAYMRGLADGGPTRSGHRTPTVVVELPVNGLDERMVRDNAWQVRRFSDAGCTVCCCARRKSRMPCGPSWRRRGIRIIVAEWTRSFRRRSSGCAARRWERGVGRPAGGRCWASGCGDAGRRRPQPRSGAFRPRRTLDRADPWPLNPNGELMLGLKLENPEGIANADALTGGARNCLRGDGSRRPEPVARVHQAAA